MRDCEAISFLRRTIVIAAVLCAPAIARAQAHDLPVRVVELAGGRAYLAPGASAGLVAGASVRLGGKTYRVVDATADNAAIDVGGDAIAIGATGTASVEAVGAARTIEKLGAPRPLAAWNGQWRDPVHPADTQEVRPVALGAGKARGRSRVTLVASAMAFVPRQTAAVATASAGARFTIEPYADTPLAFDADAAAQIFLSHGGDDAARPNLVVREARLRYGAYADPRFAAGRLRWAATSVGLLDGARLAHAVGGGLELAAFGGVVPDPMSGKPSLDASRFGAELVLDRPRDPWSPRVSLTAHGSTWKGALDERRLDAFVDAAHGPWALAAYSELSSFASGNPWGARAIDLTSAGAGASWHDGGFRLGLDLSFRRPERSLRLDAYLPPDWLCTRAPQAAGAATEPCAGNESRSQATASAAYTGAWGSIDAGATAIHATASSTSLEGSGFADLRLRLGNRARFELGASGGRAAFLDWIGARIGVGLAGRRTDVSLYYRPQILGYTGSAATFIEERAGLDVAYTPRPDVSYGVIVEGQAGNDLDAVTAIATLIWRPR